MNLIIPAINQVFLSIIFSARLRVLGSAWVLQTIFSDNGCAIGAFHVHVNCAYSGSLHKPMLILALDGKKTIQFCIWDTYMCATLLICIYFVLICWPLLAVVILVTQEWFPLERHPDDYSFVLLAGNSH